MSLFLGGHLEAPNSLCDSSGAQSCSGYWKDNMGEKDSAGCEEALIGAGVKYQLIQTWLVLNYQLIRSRFNKQLCVLAVDSPNPVHPRSHHAQPPSAVPSAVEERRETAVTPGKARVLAATPLCVCSELESSWCVYEMLRVCAWYC